MRNFTFTRGRDAADDRHRPRGLINIPVKRIAHEQPLSSHPLAVFGLDRAVPKLARQRHEAVIAVNVGGALVPVGIALYQLTYLVPLGADAIWAVVVVVTVNTMVSYFAAVPVPCLPAAEARLPPRRGQGWTLIQVKARRGRRQ